MIVQVRFEGYHFRIVNFYLNAHMHVNDHQLSILNHVAPDYIAVGNQWQMQNTGIYVDPN